MRSQVSIQREFWASAVLLVSLLGFMIFVKLYSSWFDSFFQAVSTYDIRSYRIVSLITPDSIQDPIFVAEVRDFIKALARKKGAEDLKVQIEFWIDPTCKQAQLKAFQKAVGEEYIIHYLPLQSVLERTIREGLPSILSKNPRNDLTLNILKIWSLDEPFDLNIYLDPILWRCYGTKKSCIPSAAAFGILAKAEHGSSFFINFIFPPLDKSDSRIMGINNQALIGTQRSADIMTVKKLLIASINRNESSIEKLLLRPIILKSPISESQYLEYLKDREQWHRENPEIPLQDKAWISELSGSVFLHDTSNLLSLGRLYTILRNDLELEDQSCFIRKGTTYGGVQRTNPKIVELVVRSDLIRNDLTLIEDLESPNRSMLEAQLAKIEALLACC